MKPARVCEGTAPQTLAVFNPDRAIYGTIITMILPDYWLTRPPTSLTPALRADFDALYQAVKHGAGSSIDYSLPAPKWQFLCYLADHHPIVLHGSGSPAIAQFEPRQSSDLNDFGRQKAVYAASDGIWAMFFAIVDRERYPMSVSNACIRLAENGQIGEPRYVFSVSRQFLPQRPWRTGTVYLLPRDTFTPEPAFEFGPATVHVAQLASLEPVTPLARLEVQPDDFPFLDQIHGHDDDRLQEYATAMQTGAPWPDDPPLTQPGQGPR